MLLWDWKKPNGKVCCILKCGKDGDRHSKNCDFDMNPNDPFDRESLGLAEVILTQHQIAIDYFQGELYQRDGVSRFEGILIEHSNGDVIDLDEAETGRLFMIPDGSTVWARPSGLLGEAPTGLDVRSNNTFMAEQEIASIIVYVDRAGTALDVDSLYIQRLVLSRGAPKRLATVAFGLMAITAYRHGFSQITLFAAGNGPIDPVDPDGFIGFAVWPKFGFDALLDAAEVNAVANPALRQCRTVQDVIATDPEWWDENGTGRDMYFDLRAESRSWLVLLDYLYETLLAPEIAP